MTLGGGRGLKSHRVLPPLPHALLRPTLTHQVTLPWIREKRPEWMVHALWRAHGDGTCVHVRVCGRWADIARSSIKGLICPQIHFNTGPLWLILQGRCLSVISMKPKKLQQSLIICHLSVCATCSGESGSGTSMRFSGSGPVKTRVIRQLHAFLKLTVLK